MADELDEVLTAVGPRLRALRRQHDMTLADLAAVTGISTSTLSRLESGQRRPNLELLLPLARAHRVPLDELVGAPATGDPRIHPRAIQRHGMTILPLTRRTGGLQAYKHIMATQPGHQEPDPQTHEGYEWLYVLSGRLRLVLGAHDLTLNAGEAAEFDTRVPPLVRQRRPGTRGVPHPLRPARRTHACAGPTGHRPDRAPARRVKAGAGRVTSDAGSSWPRSARRRSSPAASRSPWRGRTTPHRSPRRP